MNHGHNMAFECANLLLLVGGGLNQGLEVEKNAADGPVHMIEPCLQAVQILVQTMLDHLVDIRVFQVSLEASQTVFRRCWWPIRAVIR